MREARRGALGFSLLIATSWLSGCDVLLDAAIDCIDNDGPRLSPNVLPDPVLFETYSERVQVSISNEPRDDNFEFRFSLIGDLPEGMEFESAGRDFRLFGTPIELGVFNFSLRVVVTGTRNGFNDTSGLCTTVDTNNYVWTIQMT